MPPALYYNFAVLAAAVSGYLEEAISIGREGLRAYPAEAPILVNTGAVLDHKGDHEAADPTRGDPGDRPFTGAKYQNELRTDRHGKCPDIIGCFAPVFINRFPDLFYDFQYLRRDNPGQKQSNRFCSCFGER